MCLCVSVSVYVCVFVCVVCVPVCVCFCVCVSMCVSICISVCVCFCVCLCVWDSSWSQHPRGAGSDFPISLGELELGRGPGPWGGPSRLVILRWRLPCSETGWSLCRQNRGCRALETAVTRGRDWTIGPGRALTWTCHRAPATSGIQDPAATRSLLFHPQSALHVQTQNFLARLRRMKQTTRYRISG